MYLYGSFINQKGDTITVHILTGGDRTTTLEIGDGTSGVYFAPDPVDITSEVNDCFDHLLRQSASIRLQTANYMGDLFATTCRDVVVNIYRGSTCLFAGFVEPQSYNQPYNEVLDDLEINCIDALSALQYSYYRDMYTSGVDYDAIKSAAGYRSYYTIITEILTGITTGLNITGNGNPRLLYDGSKAISSSADAAAIMTQLEVTDLLFLGDSEDDVWTQDAVLEELLRYLNLHILQSGFNFYVFSWETIKAGGAISWYNLLNSTQTDTAYKTVTIANSIAEDTGANISIGEVFNQVQVTCEVNELENVIESPLDDDLLVQLYSKYQKYLTEFSVEGGGDDARGTFTAVCQVARAVDLDYSALDYREGEITEWYIRMKTATGWVFPRYGVESDDLVEICCQNNTNQHALPLWLASQIGACIMSWGKIETSLAHTDNSPNNKLTMEDYLIVSINGSGKDLASTGSGYGAPTPGDDDIKAAIPVAVYTSNTSGIFSPADDRVTNYLVVSGSLVLNPIMDISTDYDSARAGQYGHIVPSRSSREWRYYTRLYWQSATPESTLYYADPKSFGLVPYTGKGPEQYEFQYSGIGDSTDQISKVAVLACMLVIGDKCVVETGTDGMPSDFTWQTYKQRSECADDDEYYNQCFFIGIDPKIGDKLIGTEHNISNNIDFTMGIDAEGMAIPITKDDNISGEVTFKILGPVNTYWDEWTRRHSTWFRHSSYSAHSVPLLAHMSNIVIKGLEVKAYSDNGGLEVEESSDLVYLSNTAEDFYNKKEIDFKLTSALTSTESSELNVNNTINLSTPQNTVTGDGVVTIYDANALTTAKPEKLYVDSYYSESHLPRIILEQTLTDTVTVVSPFFHYTHPALNKSFYVLGISRNLMAGSATLTLREIGS